MYQKISRDVKLAAVNLYERQHLSLQDILACVGFSESTFWRATVVSPTCSLCGHPHVLHCDDVLYIIRLVRHRPGWFLDELLGLLDSNRFVSVHYSTNWSVSAFPSKKLKQIAKERNEQRRMVFN
ncbi:hypothetical protein F4604DRAFT_1815883 [Suillus subluteus]|nr:hypothetical protein F4604DRAFT_1815883 [Suillus subluteus]